MTLKLRDLTLTKQFKTKHSNLYSNISVTHKIKPHVETCLVNRKCNINRNRIFYNLLVLVIEVQYERNMLTKISTISINVLKSLISHN